MVGLFSGFYLTNYLFSLYDREKDARWNGFFQDRMVRQYIRRNQLVSK